MIEKTLDVDAIIVNIDRSEETILTINSLRENNKLNSIILIDNGSKDLKYLDDLQVDKVIKNSTNIGQAAAINQGFIYAHSKYIVIMHNDVVVDDFGWIKKAVDFLEHKEKVGLISFIGWSKGAIVSSFVKVSIDHPDAAKLFDKEGDFVKVERTDSIVNICRNLGIKADVRFGIVGLTYYLDYLNLGYEIYTMRASNARHLPDSTFRHGGEKFVEHRKLVQKVFLKRLKEFKMGKYKENK